MMENLRHEKIREIICLAIPEFEIEKIVLFGSRARGTDDLGSDYDIMVIVREAVTWEEKKRIFMSISREFSKRLIPVDVIIKSVEEVEYYKDKIGSIVSGALSDGVIV